jgi:FlaG/FlaF family flagellin (archaellin)
MSRGAPAIVAAGALAVILAGNVPVHAVGTTSQASARAGADSVALFATRDGGFQAVSGVSGSQPQDTKSIDIGGTSVATAINPRGGKDGLLCTNNARIKTVQDLRTTPQVGGADIDATAYSGEGAADRAFGCDGLAMHGTFALAGGGSQGLLQLVRKQGGGRSTSASAHEGGTTRGTGTPTAGSTSVTRSPSPRRSPASPSRPRRSATASSWRSRSIAPRAHSSSSPESAPPSPARSASSGRPP